jgi:tetratricopeptide (TPR) repeat protein
MADGFFHTHRRWYTVALSLSPGQETSQVVSGQDRSCSLMAVGPDRFTGKRLDSWKEIASFFGRAERTVKRWEAERGLPVHRLPGNGRSAVFAYSDELADWLKGPGQELESDESTSTYSRADRHGTSLALKAKLLAGSVPSISKSLTASRITGWLLPLALVVSVIVFVGAGAVHFRASASRHVSSAEAQDLYLKGRYFWNRRTPDDLNKAVDYFTQAIVKDPNDAQAYVGLADCYNLLREFGAMPPGEAYPRALSAAQRAVGLDDTSAEAHNSLAFATYWWLWEGVTAEREFKRALELNPNLSRAHHWYATFLLSQNRFAEAFDQIEQARKLEPSSTAILADKGLILWQSGRHIESLNLLTELDKTAPSFSSIHDYLGRIYWEKKDYAKALAEWRHLAELRHDEAGLAIANARERGFAANGLRGLRESELPLLKDMADHGVGSAYALATTYAALGKRQEALAYLQLSFDRREQAMLVGDPIPPLDNDPEYQKFRAQVNHWLVR